MSGHSSNVDAVQTHRIKEIKKSPHRAYYGSTFIGFVNQLFLNGMTIEPEVEVEVKVFGKLQ